MTVRLRPPSTTNDAPTPVDFDLPSEVHSMIFEYLNLSDLLNVELVCKIWFEISKIQTNSWKRVADQKKIPFDPCTPVRAQILHSFIHYCKAARIIFPEPLRDIPAEGSPAYNKLLIDETLVNHQASKAPRISITNLLKSPNYHQPWRDDDNLEVKAHKSILNINQMTPECMARLQVGLETKAVFDSKFFEYIENSDFGFGARVIIQSIENRHRSKTLLTPLSDGKTRLSLDFLELMDKAKDASLPFVHYLFQIAARPSLDFQFFYYKACAYSDIIKALAPIRVILKEKMNTIDPLLKDLSGDEWEKAFEAFMRESGVDLEFKIKYPIQFQDMFKTLDDERIEMFTNSILLTIPNPCSFKDLYIIQKINKCLKESVL